jgi:O-antigen ligase
VALVLVVLAIAPVDIYNRVLDVSNYSPEHAATLRIRLAYWQAAARIIEENWLTGIGAGNELAVPRYVTIDTPEQTNVHNDYLQTTMETGVFGALLFFSLLAFLLRQSLRAAAAVRGRPAFESDYWFLVACQVAMIATLVYGLQVDVFHFPLKGWWLVAGLVCVKAHAIRDLAARAEPDAPAVA